ncbi:MAG: sensor histidine kinase [Lachnospiraceae bacterium]|nr:sensor histidine kinase [Lachnospiraceae bacterium]
MKRFCERIRDKYLYDIRLQSKLLISHGLLIFLPTIVLSFFVYNNFYDSIVSDTILEEQSLAGQTASSIEESIASVMQAAVSLEESSAANWLFPEYSYQLSETLVQRNINVLIKETKDLCESEMITDIRFYVSDSLSFLVDGDARSSLFSPLSEVTGTYWYGIFSSRSISTLLCPSLYLSVTEEAGRGDLAYITQIYSGVEGEVYLAIYFSQDKLASILSANANTDNSAYYILNERDVVVSTSDASLSGAYYMSNETLSELVGGVNIYTTRSYLSDNIYVGYYSIPDTDWHLVSILSSTSLVQKGRNLVLQFIVLYIAFFLLAFAISIFLSRSISLRITALSEKMHSIHNDRPERFESAKPAHDEIGDLIETYNYMSDEINQLLDQQLKNAEVLKLKEFNALQSQINPHFLYNTLDMINWLAQIGKRKEVTQAVQALSRFYKLTLSRRDTNGSVAEELEHVSLYVQLQNMRYENRIDFIIDVPDTLADYEIPRLTLQPIVENCIQHGLMEKPEKAGTVLITGWLEGEDLVLLISDDGVGMSSEQIASILSGERKPTGGGSNVGIYNTHARLQLLYGERYGLSYESQEGQGTNTQIRLPALPH